MNNNRVASELLKIAKNLMGESSTLFSGDKIAKKFLQKFEEYFEGMDSLSRDYIEIDIDKFDGSIEIVGDSCVLEINLKVFSDIIGFKVTVEGLQKSVPFIEKVIKNDRFDFFVKTDVRNVQIPVSGAVTKVWSNNKSLLIQMDGIDEPHVSKMRHIRDFYENFAANYLEKN